MFDAPGRFSTKNDWPSTLVSSAASSRALASGPLPAGNGAMMRTGLLGYSACAAAPVPMSASPAARARPDSRVKKNVMGVSVCETVPIARCRIIQNHFILSN